MVSQIGLGMMSHGDPGRQSWALPEDQAEPIVRQAVEAGIILFDTADTYSDGASEQITGRLLRKLFTRRDDYVLAPAHARWRFAELGAGRPEWVPRR
jgi:aryl-alcohol dehydrogenase-like predicted oxidoreductase